MRSHICLLGSFVALTLACCAVEEEPSSDVVLRDGEITAPNRGGGGGYIGNGLHDPEIGGFDPDHPLSTGAGLDAALLDDPHRLATAKYVVECALPAGTSISKVIEGVPTVLSGALGLAPEWEDDACDEDCQEWVSACVLARTNVSEQTVQLWLKGDHPALGTGTNLAYPIYESSFFGNLFADESAQYMCPGLLVGPLLAQLQGRTCSATLGGYCDMTSYSSCALLPLLVPRCGTEGLITSPTLTHCRAGTTPSGDGYHTISSYVHAL
jgi:hypothetical protein